MSTGKRKRIKRERKNERKKEKKKKEEDKEIHESNKRLKVFSLKK